MANARLLTREIQMNKDTERATEGANRNRRYRILWYPLLPVSWLLSLAMLVAILAQGLGALSVTAQSNRLPNIVLIFTDDLGYADLGTYGAEGFTTPRLDQLASQGIHPEEWLLSEMLQEAGYATGCFGKWHLGDQHVFLPLQNGFDEFFGLPYSNDRWPYHPKHARFPPLPLMASNRVINSLITFKPCLK